MRYLRNLPVEARQLREILNQAERDGLCELIERSNASAEDIFKVFQDAQYRDRIAVFHYGGHANGYQLLLESATGQTQAADAGGLAAFFGQQRGLELVFLNGCSTQEQANGLLDANVSAVIATSRAIDDAVATAFAEHFYRGLAGGATLSTAFNETSAACRTGRGGKTRDLNLTDAPDEDDLTGRDRLPWDLYLGDGAETTRDWNLPEVIKNPLFGLPPVPQGDVPESPYPHLHWFDREHAEVFFGRGYQVRELYQLVTTPDTAPIILFCGQSGVGKSSLLAAGLIPRLEGSHEVRYVRRRRRLGMAGALREALGADSESAFKAAWLALEAQLAKPIVVILDQVEEIFTRPAKEQPEELAAFMDALIPIYADRSSRPRGRLILSFRKEWVLDIKRRLEERKLPHTVKYLERLDERGIAEAVDGPSRAERLQQHFGVAIEDNLSATIASDLLKDAESALGPTLQILLTKLWSRARERNLARPQFDEGLYRQIEHEGRGLDDFLDQQLAALAKIHPEAVRSGLALDVLAFHTTPRGTAEARTTDELEAHYGDRFDNVKSLIDQCVDLYVLFGTKSTAPRNSASRVRCRAASRSVLGPAPVSAAAVTPWPPPPNAVSSGRARRVTTASICMPDSVYGRVNEVIWSVSVGMPCGRPSRKNGST